MPSFFRRWRLRHLVAVWAAYWVGLGLVTLWRPVGIVRRLAQLPDSQGTITAEITNGTFSAQMMERGIAVWTGSVSVIAIVLWIAGPPLLLWMAWALSRPRSDAATGTEDSLGAPAAVDASRPALGDGVAFDDHLKTRRPRAEEVHIPRDREPR